MGLYGKNRDNRFVRIIQKLIISLLENQLNKLVFLGKGELDYAKVVSTNKQNQSLSSYLFRLIMNFGIKKGLIMKIQIKFYL